MVSRRLASSPHHSGRDQLPRRLQRQVGNSLLPPGGLHTSLHHGFMTFAAMADEFKALNTELIGLSVDSVYSHIAWLRRIHELEWKGMRNVEVKFPVIADISMDVSRKYGMIQPEQSTTQAVRAVFVIDPESKIRAIIYYPLSTGRNFDELKRLVQALQKADADSVATPADWRLGDDVIIPPAGSCGVAKDRMESSGEDMYCLDWFICFKK